MMKSHRGSSIVVSVIVSMATFSSSAIGGVLTGPIVNPANGHQYYLLESATWTDSQAEAVNLGGHLVTINDEAENNWVFDTFASYNGGDRNLWIGLNDFAQEGVMVWASGEAVTYTNFAPGAPDNTQVGENAVHIIRPSGFPSPPAPVGFDARLWNDGKDEANVLAPSVAPFHGVVEIVPEPSSLALLSLVGLLMGRRR